jgi:hypothetical protein
MRTITKKYKVYKFDELPKEIQEKALDKYRYMNTDDFIIADCHKEDCMEKLKEMGITGKEIYYNADRRYWTAYLNIPSLDFLKFREWLLKNKIITKRQDKMLDKLNMEVIVALKCDRERNYFKIYDYTAVDNKSRKSMLEIVEGEIGDQLENIFNEQLDKVFDKFLENIEAEYDYQTSDEGLKETFEANEYEFNEYGEIDG